MVVVEVRQGTLTWVVVVEVRQGTLTWIAVEQEEDEEDEEEEERRRTRQEEEATDIKSNNPHLAGGEKIAFLQCFCIFLGDFGCFPTGPNVVPKIRKLVPDWIPTGSRLDPDWPKSGAQKCKNWCPIGSRLGPDWIPTRFLQKTPISLNLSTYF